MAELSKKHLFTAAELSFLHGFYQPGLSHDKYKDCSNFDISTCPLSVSQSLLGDGMSVHCVSAWFTYLVSHMMRLEVARDHFVPLHNSKPKSVVIDFDDGPPVQHDAAVEPLVIAVNESQEITFK